MSVYYYHPGKSNVVANALTKLSMGSISHIDDEKKELVKEVHQLARLGVRLTDAPRVVKIGCMADGFTKWGCFGSLKFRILICCRC